MSCPTCDHTLSGIGYGMFHCPRCGTLVNCPVDGAVVVPALVGRCRQFEQTIAGQCAVHAHEWKSLGIAETINVPGTRKKVCPGCGGRGFWYSDDNGQVVTCNCEANTR